MAIGDYDLAVTLDRPDGLTGSYTPLDPAVWYCAFRSEGAGLATLAGHFHAGIDTATRVHLNGSPSPTTLLAFPAGSYPAQVIADGAIAYWRLDETAGPNAKDIIGGWTGTISGGVMLGQPGALPDGNTAMLFDGTSGKIQTVSTLLFPVTCTIEFWIKTSSQTQRAIVSNKIGASSDLLCGILSTGAYVFGSTIFVYGTRPLSDGAWHHCVCVMSNNLGAIYVDGTLDASTATTRNVGATAAVSFGWDEKEPTLWYLGRLDEIAIYPTALTPQQIAAHYTAAVGPAPVTQGRTFHVVSVINRAERNHETVITCAEVFG